MLTLKGVYVSYLEDSTLTLKSTNEKFKITRPKNSVHNMLIGEMFIWNEGDAIMENINTKHKA